MALLQGKRSGLVCCGIGGILDVTLGNGLDDWCRGVEGAGANWQQKRGGESRAGGSKLQCGAEECPAHDGPQCRSGVGTIAGQLAGIVVRSLDTISKKFMVSCCKGRPDKGNAEPRRRCLDASAASR